MKKLLEYSFFQIERNKDITASKTHFNIFFCTRNAFSLQLERSLRVKKINTKKKLTFFLYLIGI